MTLLLDLAMVLSTYLRGMNDHYHVELDLVLQMGTVTLDSSLMIIKISPKLVWSCMIKRREKLEAPPLLYGFWLIDNLECKVISCVYTCCSPLT